MLYINEKEATRFQNVLFTVYHQCKDIRETIRQYEICGSLEDNEITNVLTEYPKLYSVILDSMRYRIIIGMANLFDKDSKSLSIKKLLSLSEAAGIDELNKEIKIIRKELIDYEETMKNINTLRDKMFGHIEINYALEENDIYDIDFNFLNVQIASCYKLLNYIMEKCVLISNKYDGDSLNLNINWKYDKEK